MTSAAANNSSTFSSFSFSELEHFRKLPAIGGPATWGSIVFGKTVGGELQALFATLIDERDALVASRGPSWVVMRLEDAIEGIANHHGLTYLHA